MCLKNQQEINNSTQTIDIKPVTQAQVLTGIPPNVLKFGAEELSAPLTTLFNSCINNSAWPSEWKHED